MQNIPEKDSRLRLIFQEFISSIRQIHFNQEKFLNFLQASRHFQMPNIVYSTKEAINRLEFQFDHS